jgi:hypothetical protein
MAMVMSTEQDASVKGKRKGKQTQRSTVHTEIAIRPVLECEQFQSLNIGDSVTGVVVSEVHHHESKKPLGWEIALGEFLTGFLHHSQLPADFQAQVGQEVTAVVSNKDPKPGRGHYIDYRVYLSMTQTSEQARSNAQRRSDNAQQARRYDKKQAEKLVPMNSTSKWTIDEITHFGALVSQVHGDVSVPGQIRLFKTNIPNDVLKNHEDRLAILKGYQQRAEPVTAEVVSYGRDGVELSWLLQPEEVDSKGGLMVGGTVAGRVVRQTLTEVTFEVDTHGGALRGTLAQADAGALALTALRINGVVENLTVKALKPLTFAIDDSNNN